MKESSETSHLKKCEEKGDEGNWILSVDGSSNLVGNKTCIILEGPDGLMLEESLKFDFKADNKQAKYGTLLARIRLTLDVGAKNLKPINDSIIVTE